MSKHFCRREIITTVYFAWNTTCLHLYVSIIFNYYAGPCTNIRIIHNCCIPVYYYAYVLYLTLTPLKRGMLSCDVVV